VKRRIWLSGALGACVLALIAGSALAATSKKSKTPTTKVTCKASTSIMVPSGETAVLPPAESGVEFGTVKCKKLGSGVQRDSFTVPSSGDTVAKFGLYFADGTIHGTYDLTPQSTGLNFLSTDWMGTLKVLGGTGTDKGMTGTGTMTCKSPDGVHTTCTDKLVLKAG
jgi:hypothetical protein